jgi:hypothetical protein
MRKVFSIAVLVLAAGLGIGMVSTRGAALFNDAANGAPKAAPSPSAAVLAQWNDIGRKLIAMAEDFPEDKYEFKPKPEQRTFAAQLIHVSASMYYFTDPAEGKKQRYPDDPKRDDLKTKAQVVAFVKKCVEDGAAEIKAKGDKGINDLVTDPETKQRLGRTLGRALRAVGGVLPRGWIGAAGIATEEISGAIANQSSRPLPRGGYRPAAAVAPFSKYAVR